MIQSNLSSSEVPTWEDALWVPSAGWLYTPVMTAAGTALATALPALVGVFLPDVLTEGLQEWMIVGIAGGVPGAVVAGQDPRPLHGRQENLHRILRGGALAGLATLLGQGAGQILQDWLLSAWPLQGTIACIAKWMVSGFLMGAGVGASRGIRSTVWTGLVGALGMVAEGMLAPLPVPSTGPILGAWPLSVVLASLVSSSALVFPMRGFVLRVEGGKREGWKRVLGEDGMRVGSNKRFSTLFLPASDGIAPRHAEIRLHRGGLGLVSCCTGTHGVRHHRQGCVEVALEGAMIPLESGDRVELWGPEGAVFLRVEGGGA